MHLTHPHQLSLHFGMNLPEQAIKNCYGKYKKNGWDSKQNTSLRYLVCMQWKLVLCEKWYLSDPEDFLIGVNVSLNVLNFNFITILKVIKWFIY